MDEGLQKGIAKAKKLKDQNMPVNNYLLVIGIDKYEYVEPKLNNCVRDAKALEKILKEKYGFEKEKITSLYDENATKDNILKAFDDLEDKLDENDNLLFYFSGHGELKKNHNQGYWIPVEARSNTRGDFLIVAEVQNFIKTCKARHVLGIVDACYPASLLYKGTEAEYNKYYSYHSRKLITSGYLEQVTEGEPGAHSPFAYALLTSLERINKPYFSTLDLWSNMRPGLAASSASRAVYQTMYDAGDLGGEFFFLNANAEETPPGETDEPTVDAPEAESKKASIDTSHTQAQKPKPQKNLSSLPLNELKDELKMLVRSDMDKALKSIDELVNRRASIHNDFILVAARYNDVKKDKTFGVISEENASIRLNRIRYAFTSIIDDLEEEDLKRT